MTTLTTQTEAAHKFLRLHGMHPDCIDLTTELARFRADMEAGLAGTPNPGGCKMLPAYVTAEGHPPREETVLALDAGGTNLRAALVRFTAGGPVIEGLCTRPMPGTDGPVSRAEFFRVIADFAAPLAAKARRLGFCFSYPAEILPNGDGRLLQFTKEVQVPDGPGMLVCHELLHAMQERGLPAPSSFALVNDTVAALLGGYAANTQPTDGWLCLILGTGNNVCYLASRGSIRRPLVGWSSPSMIVNMESGGYCGFPQGKFDRQYDALSLCPGEYGNEKMVGGVYLGEILRLTLAGAGGLFSPVFHQRLTALDSVTSADLSELAADPSAPGRLSALCPTPEDLAALTVIADGLLERAAKLVTLTIAGPMEIENMGRSAPARVVAEGSTFWKNTVLRKKIESYAASFLGGVLGHSCSYVGAEHPNLIGAAMAALQ